MKNIVRTVAGALTLAGALATTLLSAPAASAALPEPPAASAALPEPPAFACPAGSSAVNVPNRIVAPNQPALAGTVCVVAGTTAFRSVHTNGGWRVEVKSPFGSRSTNVRFFEPTFNAKAEVLTQGSQVVVRF